MTIETVACVTDLQVKLFAAIGQILVALAVGAFAAFIAWRQWKTAHQQATTARKKLKFELFDRRLTVYEAIDGGAIAALSVSGKHKELDLIRPISEARWLFGPEIHEFVTKNLYEELVDLSEAREDRHTWARQRHQGEEAETQYMAAAKKSNETRKRVYKNLSIFRKMMDEFLVLEH